MSFPCLADAATSAETAEEHYGRCVHGKDPLDCCRSQPMASDSMGKGNPSYPESPPLIRNRGQFRLINWQACQLRQRSAGRRTEVLPFEACTGNRRYTENKVRASDAPENIPEKLIRFKADFQTALLEFCTCNRGRCLVGTIQPVHPHSGDCQRYFGQLCDSRFWRAVLKGVQFLHHRLPGKSECCLIH